MKTITALVLLLTPATAFAATISIEGLLNMLIVLVVLALIIWLLWWFVGYVGLPEPFNKVAHVLVGLVAFVILIYFLLGLLSGGSVVSIK